MKTRSQNSLVLHQLQNLASNFYLDLIKHHPHLKKTLLLDSKTLQNRSSYEGVAFLTQTLPKISKALISALETGAFETPQGFKCIRGTAIPRFCGGMLKCVFEDDGSLKKSYDHVVVNDIIQLSNLFYKLELPYSQRCERKVVENFKKTEEDLNGLVLEHDEVLFEAASLVKRVLKGFKPDEITPRHGPGSVATREKGTEKWRFRRKYRSIHKVYPYYTYFTPSRKSLLSEIPSYRGLEDLESGCARVVLVPKDSRGPRLISMEPLEYQFIQQGIARNLVRQLEIKSPLTRSYLNFTDQTINQRLALEHSLKKEYATLDMKEASDRVSVELIRHIFSQREDVLRALLATRTTYTELPDGEILYLNKFAPMGSALCFPVEALVFWALAEVLRRRHSIRGRVYVYGDDIIVPCKLASILFENFPKYGLKFNEDKCFVKGSFRESCGMDALGGIQCTPVRMRHLLPTSRKEVSSLASAVAFSNLLWERGFWNASTYVKNACEGIIHIGVLRSPKVNFGGLSYVSYTIKDVITDKTVRIRFNKDYQVNEVQTYVLKPVRKPSCWLGSARLFANLVGQCTGDFETVPHAVSLKMRWTPFVGDAA